MRKVCFSNASFYIPENGYEYHRDIKHYQKEIEFVRKWLG